MDVTKLNYVGICLISFFFSWLAERTNKKLYMFVSGAILVFYSGFRDISVGIDTKTYYKIFLIIKDGGTAYFNEKTFVLFVRWLFIFFEDPAAIFFVMSAFTIGLFYFSFWKLKDNYSISWMVLIFLLFYFARSMNIIRQYLAWAIVFYAITCMLQQKYFKSSVCIAIAMCVHLSAIVSFAILGLYLLQDQSNIRNKFKNVLLLLVLIGSLLSGSILSAVDDSYSRYYRFNLSSIGYLSLYKILVLFGIVFLVKNNKIIKFGSKKIYNEYIDIDKRIVILYFVGIIFDSLSYFSSYMSRLGLFFLSFEFLFWGRVFKSKTNTSLYKAALLVMLIYLYTNNIIGDGYGIFPYSTVFGNN